MSRRIGRTLAILVFVIAACLVTKDSSPLTPHQAAAATWAVTVDDLSSGFSRSGPAGDCSTPGDNSFNWYWCYMNSGGWGGHYFYTWNGQYYGQSRTGDAGTWRPDLPYNKTYKVCAYIPNNHAYTTNARYQIYYSGGSTTVGVNQQPLTGWHDLGNYHFAAGTSGYVVLDDITGEAFTTTQIGMDAIEWVPDSGSCGDYPAPSIPAPGAGSSRQTLFQQAYDRAGGRATMGYAFGNTYWWNGIVRQDFDSPSPGASIMHDESQDSPIYSIPAWVVRGAIRDKYINSWPDLGPPESDQFTNSSGKAQSNFRYGYIWCDSTCYKGAWPNAWSIQKPGRDTNAQIGLASVPGGSPGTDLPISGVQFTIDDKGSGGGGTGDIAWLWKDIGTLAITPNSNLTWTEFDKARSLVVALDVVGSDGTTRQLLYGLNAPDKWSSAGWVDMTGTGAGFNSWLSVTRNIYNDYLAEYGVPARTVTKLYLGHFIDDSWTGDHGGTLGGLGINDADVIVPAAPPNVQGGVTANPWVSFSAEPINLGTGEYSYQHTDVSIPGVGDPLQFARSYSSQNTASTRLGVGWQDNLSVRLAFDDSDHTTANVSVIQEQGRRDDYGRLGDGTYQDPPGIFNTLSTDTPLACWGDNSYGQATPPSGAFSQVSAGYWHTCGLRTDGTLACWGDNEFGQATPPAGTFTQVSAGMAYTCGLKTDGTVVCWGQNSFGQGTPPAGAFTQISAGGFHTCGLKTDGTLACWGDNDHGQATPPAGTFSQVSAGLYHTCGLKTDGTLACWGWNNYGDTVPPAGTFSQVSAGGGHACGLKTDGTLACWGDNSFGQATPPTGSFTQVSAGSEHTCGVRTDGTLACWGWNNDGQATPPAGTFSQAGAGGDHTCGVADSTFLLQRKDNSKWQFDANGKPMYFEDQNGNRMTLGYNPGGTLTSATDSSGHVLTFASDGAGRITSVTDQLGRVTAYGYDSSGNLISVTDPAGGVTSYTYDSQHRMTSMTDARGHTVMTNTFDSSGRVSAQTNAAGSTWTFNYGSGQTSETDPRGCTTVHVYDARFRETQKTDCLGGVTTYAYDARGNRTSITDPLGHVTSYTYDSSGNVLSVTDALGKVTNYTYDAKGDVLTKTDPLGNATTYTYDGSGNQLTITDALGKVASKSYNAQGQPVSVMDPRGNTMTYAYDANGNHVGTTDPNGNSSSSAYDAAGRLLSNTDPIGHATSFTYNPLDKVLSQTDALGNVTSHTYDANGNNLTTMDPRGKVTRYVYDALDRVSSSTDPRGGVTAYSYDSVGNRISTTDTDGHITTFVYDLLGQMTSSTDSLGHTTSYAYDAAGNRTSVTDPNGHTATSAYDADNRLTSDTDPAGNSTVTAYDANGNVISVTDPNGNATAHTYDALNRLISTTDAQGGSQVFAYDENGNRISTADANGVVTHDSYDKLNRLSTETDAASGIVSYGYDAAGNRTSVTDADGHTTRYGYDALNQLATITDPVGNVTSNSYDAAGNKVSRLDANGATTTYTYDDLNRLTRITYPDQPAVSYTYDAQGDRLSMSDLTGTTTYSYDVLNRLTSVVNPGGATVGYSYDAAGNRVGITYPDGKGVFYRYDPADRMTRVTDWTSSVTNYSYDAASRLTGSLRPNGVSSTLSYNKDNQLLSIGYGKGGANLDTVSYTVDAVGSRLTRSETVGTNPTITDAYSYDSLYRLTTVNYGDPSYPDQTYIYDPAGNRTWLIAGASGTYYNYDAADRLTEAGSTSYAFDANGNQVREGNRTFTYDRENRLLQVADWTSSPDSVCADANWDGTVNSGDLLTIANSFGVRGGEVGYDPVIDPRQDGAVNAGDLLLTAGKLTEQCRVANASAYNGDGLRVYKSDSSGNTSYVWDTQASLPVILQQSDGMTYEYGQGLLLQEKDDVWSWYLQDGLGSTVGLADATGAVNDSYTYDVFGSVRSHSGSASAAFSFAGEPTDVAGMQYLRARFYEPGLGRLMSVDPRGRESSNPYSYADENPALMTDPEGLFSFSQAWNSYLNFSKKASKVLNDLNWYVVKKSLTVACIVGEIPTGLCFPPSWLPIQWQLILPPGQNGAPVQKAEAPSAPVVVASAYYVKPGQAPPRPTGPVPGVMEPHPMGSPPPRPIPPALDPIVLQISSFNGRK